MKVTTDACIQGAWTPLLTSVRNILDIGTGTGLLALMLAQKSPSVHIDAIEQVTEAAEQARENFASSIYAKQIELLTGDARTYTYSRKYDLIISNPPFFNDSLLSEKQEKNEARHTVTMNYKELLSIFNVAIAPGGYASVLLPEKENLLFANIAQDIGWKVFRNLKVKHTENAEVKRVISLICRDERRVEADTILIIKEQSNYTPTFIELLAPYYLHL